MAFNEVLNDKIREAMCLFPNAEEKHMFGGVCYMLNGKMCVGVVKDEMMCRVGSAIYEEALEKEGAREMVFTGKAMKGYIFVDEFGLRTAEQFNYWIELCVNFNAFAKASPKKVSKPKKSAKKHLL